MAAQIAQSAAALDLSTKLASERRWVAYERTTLAWVRTATSLITFGFSVFKFFQILRAGDDQRYDLVGAHQFGLLLVNIGPISLVLATLQYRQNIPKLGAQYQGRPRSLAVIVAGLISILEILHPSIDCDDFSTMTPHQSQADPKATVDGTLRHGVKLPSISSRRQPERMKSHEQSKL